MAGINTKGEYPEKISSYLKEKIQIILEEYGEDSFEYRALALQYIKQKDENIQTEENNRRHWEADVVTKLENTDILHGMERLYNRTLVIEPTMICASHCRYCLRGNYDVFTVNKSDLCSVAKYCGTVGKSTGLNEVLITGGDPLIAPDLLNYLIDCLIEYADNIRIIRIATRLITHDPQRIGNTFFNILKNSSKNLRFEIATQINHSVEFFPETIEVIEKIRETNTPIYAQNVLLKGVNDDKEELLKLYNTMRYYDVEPHYLFHCVPIKGMHHLRTTVQRGIELTEELVNSGKLSGRGKPMYTLMTDIGKVTLYDGVISDKKDGYLHIRTKYKYADRLKWNPSWVLPETAYVDDNGYIGIRYLDGH